MKCFNIIIAYYCRVSKVKYEAPDTGTRRLFSWPVHNDTKGTKKIQMVYEVKSLPALVQKPLGNKKKKQKKRRRSVLRSSPPRPRGSRDDSDDDWDQAASTTDLRSPTRRAPTVPGLGISPQPPADTPNRMRQRRRSAQLRCRNAGCPESSQTFSSLVHRRRHEEERCLARTQVYSSVLKLL